MEVLHLPGGGSHDIVLVRTRKDRSGGPRGGHRCVKTMRGRYGDRVQMDAGEEEDVAGENMIICTLK